jgi:hypothetical protein
MVGAGPARAGPTSRAASPRASRATKRSACRIRDGAFAVNADDDDGGGASRSTLSKQAPYGENPIRVAMQRAHDALGRCTAQPVSLARRRGSSRGDVRGRRAPVANPEVRADGAQRRASGELELCGNAIAIGARGRRPGEWPPRCILLDIQNPLLDLPRRRFRPGSFGRRGGGPAAVQFPDRRRGEEDPFRQARDPRGRARDPPRWLRRRARRAPAARARGVVSRCYGAAARGNGAGDGPPRCVPAFRAAHARAPVGAGLDPFDEAAP